MKITEEELTNLKRCLGGNMPHELIIFGGPSCPVCFFRDLWMKYTEDKREWAAARVLEAQADADKH